MSKSDVRRAFEEFALPKVNFIQGQSCQDKLFNFLSYLNFLLLRLPQFSRGTRDAFELISKH